MKFTVDRKTWYRGYGSDNSKLLLENGMMCCLGHISLQCGLTERQILHRTTPYRAITNDGFLGQKVFNVPVGFDWLLNDSHDSTSEIAGEMMNVNDSIELSEEIREKRLIELAAKAGHELEFIN